MWERRCRLRSREFSESSHSFLGLRTPEEELKPSTGKADERNINLNENSGADRNKQGETQEAIPIDTVLIVDLPVNTGPSAETQPNTGHSTQLDALPFRPKRVNFDKAYPWQVTLV